MVLYGHVHIGKGAPDPAGLLRRMGDAGVAGGAIISRPPACFGRGRERAPADERLDNLLMWTAGHPSLRPLFWIDPTADDALRQVALAVDRGVEGFKVIASRHEPDDARAMKAYAAIAETGRPILFHSGILWDGAPSSEHCRPAKFEALLDVPRLRFALAHVGWPWCDELIAVYGKFEQARKADPQQTAEMFVDTTPGTPPIYRRDVLTRLFTVGYDVARNVFFGTDCFVPEYNSACARQWIERDRDIYNSLGLGEAVQRQVFGENLERFLGV